MLSMNGRSTNTNTIKFFENEQTNNTDREKDIVKWKIEKKRINR